MSEALPYVVHKYEGSVSINDTKVLKFNMFAGNREEALEVIDSEIDWSDLDISLKGTLQYGSHFADINEEFSPRLEEVELLWKVDIEVTELE